MSKTFATSTFANGLLAILAGVVANYLAENLGFGPTAPFALAILCFFLCFFIVFLTWSENYGNQNIQLWQSYKEGAQLIWSNRPIFWIGMVQSIVESCMYIFVFLWTPVMLISSDEENSKIGQFLNTFLNNSYKSKLVFFSQEWLNIYSHFKLHKGHFTHQIVPND